MWWRLRHRDYEEKKGESNRLAFKALVEEGPPPGVLAYSKEGPVGWCAIAPRGEYQRLKTSRLFPPIDDQPVWSITCLFIAPDYRGRGVAPALIQGALDLAGSQGATVVEAYAVAPKRRTAPVFLSHGPLSVYQKAGFRTIKQPSPTRHLMRIQVRNLKSEARNPR